jgi:hypothetical protein
MFQEIALFRVSQQRAMWLNSHHLQHPVLKRLYSTRNMRDQVSRPHKIVKKVPCTFSQKKNTNDCEHSRSQEQINSVRFMRHCIKSKNLLLDLSSLSTYINAATTGRILVKFGTGNYYKNTLTNPRLY